MEIHNTKIKDALDELIVDGNQPVDINILADLLKGNMTLSREGNINYENNFYNSPEWKRMVLYLLARKAIALKNLKNIKEKASYKEVAEGAFIPATSVPRTHLKSLKGVVLKDKEGYYIPNYNLIKCKSILTKKDNN